MGLPARRIVPIGQTVARTCRHLIRHTYGLALLSLPLLALTIAFNMHNQIAYADDPLRARSFGLGDAVLFVVDVAVITMLFTNAIRLILIGPAGPRSRFGIGWGWRETFVLLRSVLFWSVPVMMFVAIMAVARLFGETALPYLVLFAGICAWAFLWSRLVPYVVAPALDVALTLRDSWAVTRGNALHIVGCAIVIFLPVLLILFILAGTAAGPAPATAAGWTGPSFGGIAFAAALFVLWNLVFTSLAAEIFDRLLRVDVPAIEGTVSP